MTVDSSRGSDSRSPTQHGPRRVSSTRQTPDHDEMSIRILSTGGRAVLLALLVALAAVTSVAIAATPALAQDHDVELDFSEEEAGTGEEVVVDLTLSGADGDEAIAGYDITVTFDPEVVEFNDIEGEDFDDPSVNTDDADDGEVTFSAQQGDDPAETSFNAASVTFDVVGGEGAVTDIGFANVTVMDEQTNSYVIEATDGAVSVSDDGDATPATFDLSDVEPESATVESDEMIDISASVTNAGDFDGTDDVELNVDGETVDVLEDIELDAGESDEIEFYGVEVPHQQGEYEYELSTSDDNHTESFTVEPAHEIEATLENVTAEQNETADVSLGFESANESEWAVGGYEVSLEFDPNVITFDEATGEDFADPAVNDDDADDGSITLQGIDMEEDSAETPVDAATISFDVHGEAENTSSVLFDEIEVREDPQNEYDVLGLDGAVTVDESDDEDDSSDDEGSPPPAPAPDPGEPEITLSDVDLSENAIDVGDDVEVTVEVENVGDADGTETIELVAEEEVIDSTSVSLDADSSETVTFTETFDEAGEFEIVVNEVDAGSLAVGAADLQVTDTEVSETDIDVGESVEVTATVENVGDADGTEDIELTTAGEVVESESVSLDAGSSETFTYTKTFDEAGEFEVAIDEDHVGTVVVDDDESEDDDTPADDTPTDDDTPVDDDDDDTIPGFGAVAALLGMLILAVGARRSQT